MNTSAESSSRPTEGLGEGRLGVIAITFFVVSAAGPLVAMAGGIPVAMLFGNGAGMPAVFAILTVVLLLFSVGYTAMARHQTQTGAFYALIRASLGLRMGGGAGMLALLSYNTMQIGLYGLFGVAANQLAGGLFGVDLPWWAYSLPVCLIIGVLGYRQIDLSVALLGLLCAGEYLVVLVLDGAVIGHGGHAGLSAAPFTPHFALSGSPMIGLMLGFSAFIGFEATTIYSEEARDPHRSIPIATFTSVLLIGTFYTVSSWAAVMAIGTDKVTDVLHHTADPSRLLFDLAQQYVGWPLVWAMHILFVTSIFAGMLAFHNAIARYCFALGRARILPGRFGISHAVHLSPHMGSVAQTALASTCIAIFAITGSDPVLTVFTLFTAVGTLGVLLLMTVTSVAIVVFSARRASGGAVVVGTAVVALGALGAITILAAWRFDLLTGSANSALTALPLSILVAAAVGAFAADRSRGRE